MAMAEAFQQDTQQQVKAKPTHTDSINMQTNFDEAVKTTYNMTTRLRFTPRVLAWKHADIYTGKQK